MPKPPWWPEQPRIKAPTEFALTRVLFSHSPLPQTVIRTDVPDVAFAATEQPTATDGLGVDEP